MLVVLEFNGIVIMMHYEKGEQHHTPHFPLSKKRSC